MTSSAVISHKPCWLGSSGPVTDGGFPSQVRYFAQLFSRSDLLVTVRSGPPPTGTQALSGPGLGVLLLPEPGGRGAGRKLNLLPWLVLHGATIVTACRRADVVHCLVPGDVGTLGILFAQIAGCKTVVRHCGTWGHRGTLADRFLAWWLPRLARSGKAIVFATGAGDRPPAPGGPNLHWIFSTALTADDIAGITPARPWRPGIAPKLACVGRLTRGKNFHAVVEALVEIRRQHPEASLEILGDGPAHGELEELARRLGLDDQAVRIRGNVDREEVLRSLSASHLFVFPTRVAEGFPKAVVEALACGLPVLAPAVSVIPRLLAEGGGTLLSATDASSVARGVLDLLAAPERLPDMGAAARRTASAYTLERWRDEIGRVLEAAWGPLRSP